MAPPSPSVPVVPSSLDVLAACFLTLAAYRGRLWWELATADIRPFSTVFSNHSPWEYLACSSWDGWFSLAFAGVYAALLGAARPFRPWGPRATNLAAAAGLVAVGWWSSTHLRLLFTMGSGLDRSALDEAAATLAPADLLGWMRPLDVIVGFLPLGLLLAFRLLPSPFLRARDIVLAAFFALSLGAELLAEPPRRPLDLALQNSPVNYTLMDLRDGAVRDPDWLLSNALPVTPEQEGSVALIDPRFSRGPPPGAPREGPAGGPYNVVVVILESTARGEAMGPHRPMPFLAKVAAEGLELRRHHSTSNSSPRAIFSIFSGLYPEMDEDWFCTRADVDLPGLPTWLPEHRDRFVFSPGRLRSFFPLGFLRNAGFSEVHDYETLGSRGLPEPQEGARNEIAVVSAFLDRMTAAAEPFLGVYYSFVPHYWYADYGEAYRVVPGVENRHDRYLNALYVLDRQVERIFGRLEEDGRLGRTVLLLVGDHGEAFGQHKGNVAHSRRTYEENLHVPAIFWQPAVFAPRVEDRITSHVDLLPTLLGALGIGHDPAQGEAMLGDDPLRRYVFAVGNEGSWVSISPSGTKLIASARRDRCQAFDLLEDPAEERPSSCAPHEAQLKAMMSFARFQSRALPRWSRERGER